MDILREIPVEVAYKAKPDLPKIANNLPIQRILPLFADREEDCFPVVNKEGEITGLLSMGTLRAVIGEEGVGSLIVAEDIKTKLDTVSPNDNLQQALGQFLNTKYSSLPVVDPEDPNTVLGFLTYHDLISAYDEALIRWSTDS